MTLAHVVFKPQNPFLIHLIQIFPLSHTLPHFLLPLYSITRQTNRSYYSSLPSDNLVTVNKLISIFTQKQPLSLVSTTELTNFGSKLTTDVVETALKSFKNWKTALRFFNWASTQNGYHHSCYTYNAMASILSGARQNAAMKELSINLIKSKCYMSAGALGFFVRCLGGLGMVNEANELFDQVKELGCVPNNYSYNSLLEAISKSGSVDLMAMRMNEMKDNGWKPDKYTLTSVIQCYCKAGKFEQAFEVFQQIDELNWVDSYIFTILIISLSKGGEVDKAIYLINKMDDFKIILNEKTFYVLIHGFVKEGKVDYALTLFKKMQTLGFVPEISLYAVLIEGLCKRKELTKALQLYSQLSKMGIHPDVNLLKALVSSLSDEKEMMSLLKEAKDYLNKTSMTTLCNAALITLVKSGSIDKAYHLIQSIMKDYDHVPLDASSFEIVIDGLIDKGNLDVALDLFNEMDQIDCKRSLLLYNNMINALSNEKKVEKCHELLKEMKDSGFPPSQFTHNSIFGYYCKVADVAGAIDMLHEMHTHGHQPWIKHYTLLVKQLSRISKVAEASNFLTIMVDKGFLPDMIVYSAVIDGWLKIGELDYALKMFKGISGNKHCPDVVTYNTIINGLCKAKKVSEANDIYQEMIQKCLIPSVVTYNLLIDAYFKNGDIDQAIGFFKMMSQKGRNPNVVTYTCLIDGLCNVGRSDEALVIWNEMCSCTSPNKIAYMALVNGLCKCRKPDEGLIYFEEMKEKDMNVDSYVYVALIEAFVSVSNAAMGVCVLRKMIGDERVPDLGDKNCGILREVVVKLLDDELVCEEIRRLIEDGSVPIHLVQT
ncbi:unnamed protein product [Lactuca virosa]|uniref:PROP1-like PPR domain-containing protein n=1 Tax=Lactuca virosa TaxID=75947 RepID=A0AAU9MZ90_9ASTR|nr:unnamed protein product [Lactuca virosa]